MREASRLLELLTHADADWRRQGRELAKAVETKVVSRLFDDLQRGRWIVPPPGALAELLEVLATHPDHDARRRTIRALPPFHTDDLGVVRRIAEGFPHLLELRVVWRGAPDAFELPSRFGVRSLWVGIPHAPHGGRIRVPNDTVALTLAGWSAPPIIEGGEGLRSLAISGSKVAPPLERWAEQLESLDLGHLPLPQTSFPHLRRLRVGSLSGALDTNDPLETLHVDMALGRGPLDQRAVAVDTHVRVDEWLRPERSLAGDPRLRWLGPVDADWAPLLLTLPRLEVVDLSVSRRPFPLPPKVLPAPRLLWLTGDHQPLSKRQWDEAVEEWAHRGRDCQLRPIDPPTDREAAKLTVQATPFVRAFQRTSLRDAKNLVHALLEDRLVALTVEESVQWQALLQLAGLATDVERT